MAVMNAMSIGFSVFHTSGAEAAKNAPSANVTAKTISAPQNSRRRTGSSGSASRRSRLDRDSGSSERRRRPTSTPATTSSTRAPMIRPLP